MRTQEEILKRCIESDDMFGTQHEDLLDFLSFEKAKPLLTAEYVAIVESGAVKYEVATDAKNKILDYLDFAYEKAEGQRGLSAGRSMLHFKSWIWLDDDVFYKEIIDDIDNYTNYGIPALDKISIHYGFKKNK